MGPNPVVSSKDTGQFPPEFEAKYEEFKKKDTEAQNKAYAFFNKADPKGNSPPGLSNMGDLLKFIPNFVADYQRLQKEQAELKAEAVKLGLANP